MILILRFCKYIEYTVWVNRKTHCSLYNHNMMDWTFLAVEVYKCVHGLNPTYLNDLFTEPLANYNFRDKCRLHQPQFHTYTYGFRSFKYSGSKLWNSLPRAIKNTNDINEFKKNITEWCQTCDLSKLEIFWCTFLFQIQAITMHPFVTFTGVVY